MMIYSDGFTEQSSDFNYKETNEVIFYLNNNKIRVDTTKITPKTTLNEYLRKTLHLTGTKYMCLEGGCGACVVTATINDPKTKTIETKAVNSCLVTVLMIEDWHITTIEGLGNRSEGYHAIQQKIVQFNATQCGFCTPGMVMNMYALQQSGADKVVEIEKSFGGHLCRCTGYRPILSAFKSMATNCNEAVLGYVPDIEEVGLCSKINACMEKCTFKNPKNLEIPKVVVTDITEQNRNEAENYWYKVYSVDDIFKIINRNRGKTYQLVAGNTAHGIYKDMNDRDYFIDISGVEDLKGFSHNTSKLVLGANITLNEAMNIFQKVAQSDDGFTHLQKVANHIDLVAHVAIRNFGTLAGNLGIKHAHNEFPSDIFLLLETINATLVIKHQWGENRLFPSDYLQFDMDGKIIYSIEIPPLDSTYRFDSYKIMKRAQNTHAIINAGFLFKFKDNKVEKCTLVFGNVTPRFIHAKETENLIKEKNLFDNQNMQSFFATLLSEIQPDDTPPEPKSEFRKKLCVSLFYKYILSIAPVSMVSPSNLTGGIKLIRAPLSTGVQDYKTNNSMYPIGEPILKLEAADQASGEAKFVTDKDDYYDQRFAVFVLGEANAGSTLKSINPRKALAMEGVDGFFQATDIPGVNSFTIPKVNFHVALEGEEIFLEIGDKIKYFFQPVGAIVAKSQKIAEEAAKLVQVTFEETKTNPVLTTKDAITHSERVKDYNSWHPKKQNTKVPVKFGGTFDTISQYHYHMELQVASVYPEDNGESYIVNVGTQNMDSVQSAISRSMNIPAHKIKISVKRVGGSFGAKSSRANWAACVATLAAVKLRKPVKLFMSLEANMNMIGKRHQYRSQYQIGVENDGLIGYLNNNIYSNIGSFRSSDVETFTYQLYEDPYNSDTYDTKINVVRTDQPAAIYMRSPGSMEGSAIIETIMEHIACKLGKDPVDVRLKNLKDNKLLKNIFNQALEWSGYKSRKSEIEKFNQENTWRKKGIAFVPMGYKLTGLAPHFVQISIFHADGTVAISHGGIELGQGINTKVAQVAAYLLGIDISLINIWPSNNFTSPNNTGTASSVTTEGIILALQPACSNLLDRINKIAEVNKISLNATWLEKVQNAFSSGVSLTENSSYNDKSFPHLYSVYGAAVSEIELDVLTGQIIVQRADLVEDTGDSMNPYIDVGQVEGAYVMGLGYWTSEEIIFDIEGALKTNSTWNYIIPGARDIPVDFRVKFPDGIPNPLSPYKNKATSEPPICLAFSVPLAIKHALMSVRTQFDKSADPWATMNGPCSVEWIFMNSNHDISQYKL